MRMLVLQDRRGFSGGNRETPARRRPGGGRRFRAFLLTSVLGGWAGAASAGDYALLIGTNSYQSVGQIPPLTYPEKDVDSLRTALERQGFTVTPLKRNMANREEIIRELTRFALTLKKEDQFLLAFSGHGVRDERMNKETYWLTYNTQLDSLDVAGIRLKHLLDYVRDIPAGRKIVLLDHCYSGNVTVNAGDAGNLDASATGPGAAPRGPVGTIGLELRGQSPAVSLGEKGEEEATAAGLVLLAASYGAALESSAWEHGVFTKAVLEALDEFKADLPAQHGDGNGEISVSELVNYVEARVTALAAEQGLSQRVVPQQFARGLGQWVIARHGQRPDIAAYKAALREWADQHWIGADAFIGCLTILEAVAESAHTNIALTPEQERKLGLIRDMMAAEGRSPKQKAQALNLLFTSNGGPP